MYRSGGVMLGLLAALQPRFSRPVLNRSQSQMNADFQTRSRFFWHEIEKLPSRRSVIVMSIDSSRDSGYLALAAVEVAVQGTGAMPCQPGFTENEYNVMTADVITEGQFLLKGTRFLPRLICFKTGESKRSEEDAVGERLTAAKQSPRFRSPLLTISPTHTHWSVALTSTCLEFAVGCMPG
ncbi:Cadherin-2 [Anabarilius grahami]|uniref:Cadherin-2 n=1 Tax=Anabarilius grahami TaxID=495550 RepID=A0A3N0Y822_ANAGA|nr:Cadherin-2 [Anabarilius grahami]